MPGLMDTHSHMMAREHRAIGISNALSIADLQAPIWRKAGELGPGEWIAGFGWDESQLAEERVPLRGGGAELN